MKPIDVLTTQQPDRWMQVLEDCAIYDFYHLPQYHRLAEDAGEGTARLLVYREGDYTIALPLLLRSLDGVPLDRPIGNGWTDATSVYGYAGPVCSHEVVPEPVICNFQYALKQRLRDLQVVTVFSRFHPLFSQRALVAELGECREFRTVSIDLTEPLDVQRAKFRKSFKEGINRIRRLGMTCVLDRDGVFLEDFIHIYHETMRRVGAAERYFFPPIYFERLRAALDSRLQLFVCLMEGKAVCAGLFVACHGILQYHLGGTSNEALRLSPMRLLIDEVRLIATEQGIRVLHLGGGATPRLDDSLLHFKMGFSNQTHEFSVWRWVLFEDVYRQLCENNSRWNESHGLRPAIANFFPEYRCPTTPTMAPAPSLPAAASHPESKGLAHGAIS